MKYNAISVVMLWSRASGGGIWFVISGDMDTYMVSIAVIYLAYTYGVIVQT